VGDTRAILPNSVRTLRHRWQAGKLDYGEAKRRLAKPASEKVITIRRKMQSSAA
jgi:hypothetical protein